MRIEEQIFSANIQLPCRIFSGPDATLELSGTASSIETGRLFLDLACMNGPWQPGVGDAVMLELSLPVDFEPAKARCLSVRAKVASVKPMPDGSYRLELLFRRPVFRDRANVKETRKNGSTGRQWEM